MDKSPQEDVQDISPQTERALAFPLSPKRPRIDYTVTNNHSGKTRVFFPELLTFLKTIDSQASMSMLQKNSNLVCTAECGYTEDEKPHEQQYAKLIDTSVTKVTTLHTDVAPAGSSKVFPPLVKDEQPQFTQSDKLSSYPPDDAGGALAEPHTSQDISADMSTHPDCKRQRESLEEEPPGGCNPPAGNGEDEKQVRNRVSQIQAFTHSSSDEEIRCQSGCAHEDMVHNTAFCNTWRQSAEAEDRNQEKDKHENVLFNMEKEEGNSPISSSYYAGTKSLCSNPEEDLSGKLTEGVNTAEKILHLQVCENENVTVCDEDTKGQVNENGLSKKFIPSATKCAEGSVVSFHVVSARNTAAENVSFEADGFCGAKGEHATGKMLAKARSETADHTTETPMPTRISQEPAEGDNDVGPFSVIDPAIWSETDREAEQKRCNSESTAGAELSPSVKVYDMEMPLPLCSDVRPSQEVSAPGQTWQFNHQSRTQRFRDEKEDLCQSYTESQDCSITTNETQRVNEGSCLWKSSPSSSPELPPAEDGTQESQDTVGDQLKEQDQPGCFLVSLDHLKVLEVEYLQTKIAKMDEAAEIRGREEMTSFNGENNKHRESENSVDFAKRLHQNENHKEDSVEISKGECLDGWTLGETSKFGNKLTHIDELGKDLECPCDHPYNPIIPIIEVTTEGNERTVQGNSAIPVTSVDGHHQQQHPQKGDMTEASPDDCISEWKEGSVSKHGNKLTPVSQHEQGNKLNCRADYQHKAETFIDESKHDVLAFTLPATSDGVVPGPHELIPSQTADNIPTALICGDRFSPSVFTFCNHVLAGFDTFAKIQFSLVDDGVDAGLSNNPLLTSLPGQLLKTPQKQLHHSIPEAESSTHEEVPEEEEEGEEEVGRLERRTENMANGFYGSDYSYNELPYFISAADVTAPGRTEQQPNSESACNCSGGVQDVLNQQSKSSIAAPKSDCPTSDVNNSPNFLMKNQFDRVLKELNLYFHISMNEFVSHSRAPSTEQCSDVTAVLEDDTSDCKVQFSRPGLRHHRGTSSDHSLDTCGGDPVVSCTPGSGDGEQEVPLSSRLSQEESVYTAEKHREPQEMEQKRKMWSPSFMCRPFLEQLSHRPPEQPRRLEPLITCTRPIRVGLSKRAKTKHLHPPHPYR
uniref:uncharacterized protein LOC124050745 n=1 Tax=Scatophagus argus TaxID=75038 RepID=UPI001ED7D744|nr:uncharacterized protein LOC124050745 [Scatophagus argus]XP_046229508.1 uncharacterized protein LOC124050745 [Scatophagus argus]